MLLVGRFVLRTSDCCNSRLPRFGRHDSLARIAYLTKNGLVNFYFRQMGLGWNAYAQSLHSVISISRARECAQVQINTSAYIKISVAIPAVDGPSKPGSCRLINAVAAKVYVDSLNLMQFAPSQAQRCRSDVLCSAGFEIGKCHRSCVTAVDPYD